uniref:Major facilitator superfamily protein n=1 Tax=Pyxidicoccus fallax TaxID=394095 RepID=A0A3S5GXW2_9BACT|nr:major facilitator superfamily protein [Pyxidicoccus fallax]
MGSAFPRFWAGQTLSALGSQVTVFALPLLATSTVGAGAMDLGLLGAAQMAPPLLFGLPAGSWVDRLPRRATLICADLGRALLLLPLMVLGWQGALRLWHLYAVAFLSGCLTVAATTACQAFLPALVEPQRLVEANARLGASQSLARLLGPAMAGVLVAWMTAPLALGVDVLSFLVSAALLAWLRVGESGPRVTRPSRGLWRDTAEGLGFLWRQPLLGPLATCAGLFNLFGGMILGVYFLYVTRELGMEPRQVGSLGAVFGLGALVGALLAGRLTARLGVGPALVGALALGAVADLLIPAAGLHEAAALPLLVAAQLLIGLTNPLFQSNVLALYQALTPEHLRGRVGAALRFLVNALLPVGSLLGGVLGEALGLRQSILLAALGTGLCALGLLPTPLRGLRSLPAPVEVTPPTPPADLPGGTPLARRGG